MCCYVLWNDKGLKNLHLLHFTFTFVRNFGVSETGSCRLQYGLLSILRDGFIETVEHKFEVD